MDAFTEIEAPIPAAADFDVNLRNGDFGLKLDLKPREGRYRGVPLARVDGKIDFSAQTRGTNFTARTFVDIPLAIDRDGRRLAGSIGVVLSNGCVRLAYDAKSDLAFADALAVVGFLTPEDLSMVECESAPVLTVRGASGVRAEDSEANRVDFTAALRHGSFYGLRLNNLRLNFALAGDTLTFTNVTATGKTGGKYRASSTLELPGFDPERARFALDLDIAGGSLDEMSDFFKFDLGERRGRVDGTCRIAGPATDRFREGLSGEGSVRITDGLLGRMKLFAGLTKLLADKVPGIGFLVNQSQANCSFRIADGVLVTDDLYIEGGFISLKAWGRYDIAKDDLDFTVRVQFLKNDSMMGKIVHPITWPFTKLLLESKATGPLDDPKWEYISIIDRIL